MFLVATEYVGWILPAGQLKLPTVFWMRPKTEVLCHTGPQFKVSSERLLHVKEPGVT